MRRSIFWIISVAIVSFLCLWQPRQLAAGLHYLFASQHNIPKGPFNMDTLHACVYPVRVQALLAIMVMPRRRSLLLPSLWQNQCVMPLEDAAQDCGTCSTWILRTSLVKFPALALAIAEWKSET